MKDHHADPRLELEVVPRHRQRLVAAQGDLDFVGGARQRGVGGVRQRDGDALRPAVIGGVDVCPPPSPPRAT